jgi:metal-sulfur cluster biosynthetic enzyme
MTTVDRVMDALAGVYDPELDESITSLRFVSACEVSTDGDVRVALRLPTPQCAPNFAFLMAADARRAVRAVAGVRAVTIVLEDHYTGDEINEAIARGDGFTGIGWCRCGSRTCRSAGRRRAAWSCASSSGSRLVRRRRRS